MNLELLVSAINVLINKVLILEGIEKHVLLTQPNLDNQKIKYVSKPFSIRCYVLHGKKYMYFQGWGVLGAPLFNLLFRFLIKNKIKKCYVEVGGLGLYISIYKLFRLTLLYNFLTT